MNASLRGLSYIVAAAECANVSEAARRLNVSQPSISAAISQFEEKFAVQIFIRRHARGVMLTPAGERIVREARMLLTHAQDFSQMVSELGEGLTGEVVVGAFPSLAIRYMPQLLGSLAELHPGIVVVLHEGDQDELLAGLAEGRIEVALSYTLAVPGDVTVEPLQRLHPHAVLAARHPLAGSPAVDLKALAGEPFLLLDLPHSRDYFLRLFSAEGVQPQIAHRSRSTELLRGLVAHGRGYTLHNALPDTPYTYDGGRVSMVPLSGTREPTEVAILTSHRARRRPAVSVLLDHVRHYFGEEGTRMRSAHALP
ncbi:LysR family transcriptional regulator [Acuticoccus sp. MNP-M23]|uniref:LysR family transcriptional regulator n=1 Tax=Acuticoccus sp. MNP-M23 TaxID=3072793 RepID=UPI00281596B5|nr:LysR family transcriptional regulator [Acuticoccus sp. MNP-M23]WMS43808.1 LysR family transcriptional regulator [Acuticoccus sp. MNP-M23]